MLMRNLRIISRLDIKNDYLVKGIQLEGLRKIGAPNEYAKKYYLQGIDEIIYIDIVASLYERNSLLEIVNEATKNVFVPMTVGGGIRTINDVEKVLRVGADKVSVNTAAIKEPQLISKIASTFGNQCLVISIEAKKNANSWEAYYDNGRERSGLDAIEWAQQCEELGAGELLLTSVDKEGTGKGFDVELIRNITEKVKIPVIASGGMGNQQHLVELVKNTNVDAVCMAKILHYDTLKVSEIRDHCLNNSIPVRKI